MGSRPEWCTPMPFCAGRGEGEGGITRVMGLASCQFGGRTSCNCETHMGWRNDLVRRHGGSAVVGVLRLPTTCVEFGGVQSPGTVEHPLQPHALPVQPFTHGLLAAPAVGASGSCIIHRRRPSWHGEALDIAPGPFLQRSGSTPKNWHEQLLLAGSLPPHGFGEGKRPWNRR